MVSGLRGVSVEHLCGLLRELPQILTDEDELTQDVLVAVDDVAAD